MNIFEYDGEEFDKKLDEIFANINKEKLKKELIECGLEITQLTYNIKNETNILEDDLCCAIESQQIELNGKIETITINDNSIIKDEGENEKWMKEELALAA